MATPSSRQSDAPAPRAAREAGPQSTPHRQETIKETFESIIIALVLAFVFRGYIVEAFVIPTGSMAPTLMGAHLDVSCEQCGYRFATDVPDRPGQSSTRRAARGRGAPGAAVCAMCRYPNAVERDTVPASGDRILVQKYVYQINEPRRFDVVVFKNPEEPRKNFIKRLVGLPGEKVYLFEGNVYTRPTDGQGPWRIARKTDAQANPRWERVQRAVWQPIYDSRYIPRDGGDDSALRGELLWEPPWVPEAHPERWLIDGRRSYEYTAEAPGRIVFDFENLGYQSRAAPAAMVGRYPYNQFKYDDTGELIPWHPIEDVRLAATFQPEGTGLRATLSTTARLDRRQAETLAAIIEPNGILTLTATAADGRSRELGRTEVGSFAPGRAREVELWYVDQEASVWIDGERVLVERFDLPLEALLEREPAASLPEPSIAVAGTPVTLHRVQLDRDIYYTTVNPGSQRSRARLRRDNALDAEPLALGPDEFFTVGDNTPWSYDGRYWSRVDPWVQHSYLEGIDAPERLGVVPRELMMGRAFFVYYPAPFALRPGAPRVFPNFGDMRFIR